jgi:hypothetical protein
MILRFLCSTISYLLPSLFRYDGLLSKTPKHFPMAYVVYPDGEKSISMAIGNAYEYAQIFDGKVVRN